MIGHPACQRLDVATDRQRRRRALARRGRGLLRAALPAIAGGEHAWNASLHANVSDDESAAVGAHLVADNRGVRREADEDKDAIDIDLGERAVFVSRSTTVWSLPSPRNSAGAVLAMTSIRGCSSTFSTTTLLAESVASRVTIDTCFANLVRKMLSSPAELPPPMTSTCLSR